MGTLRFSERQEGQENLWREKWKTMKGEWQDGIEIGMQSCKTEGSGNTDEGQEL